LWRRGPGHRRGWIHLRGHRGAARRHRRPRLRPRPGRSLWRAVRVTPAPRRGTAGWPSAASNVVAVIGDPIAHSLSPLLHNTAFAHLGLDWVSVGFRVPAGAGADALAGARALGLAGL